MKPKAPETIRQKITIFLAILLVLLTSGGLLLFPWLIDTNLGGEAINRYDPNLTGRNALFVIKDPAGNQIGWESSLVDDAPNSFMLQFASNPVLYEPLSNILGFDPQSEQLLANYNERTLQFKENIRQTIDQDGNLIRWVSYISVQTRFGEHLIFTLDVPTLSFDVFNPSIQTWPTDLTLAQMPITGQSVIAHSQQSYESSLDIRPLAPQDIPAEWQPFAPCVSVAFQLDRGEITNSRRLNQIFCEDIGLVSEARFDPDDKLIETLTLVSTNEFDLQTNPIQTWPNQFKKSTHSLPDGDISNWQLTRFAQLPILDFASQPSQPLTLLRTDPPRLFSARASNASVAFNTETAKSDWAAVTQNTIYGTPAVNPENGLIYFGSSDKRLYTFSPSGMFIDSIQTEDSVVTQPVFGSNTVWFGSEDGNIYCMSADLDTSTVKTLNMGAPIASSPVAWQNTAIFAGDSGSIVAVDPACNLLWEYTTDSPIEAPLVLLEDGAAATIYFAGQGQIGALNAANGSELWINNSAGSFQNKPALTSSAIYAINFFDQLEAYDRLTGRLLWSKGDRAYSGTPQIVGKQLLINTQDGDLILLSLSGEPQTSWPISTAQLENDVFGSLPIFSPIIDEGKIWIIDDAGVIYKLTPAGD